MYDLPACPPSLWLLLPLLLLLLYVLLPIRADGSSFPTTRHDPYLGSFSFFRAPLRFLNTLRALGGHRAFWLFRHRVVMVRGLAGRDVFFSKGLDFMAGYRLLNPQLVDIMPASEIKGDESWASFMATFIRSEVLERLLPTMVDDVASAVRAWGAEGTLDPFDALYEMIFLLSMRVSTCVEFCSEPASRRELMSIFDALEAGSTPSSLILPYIPTPTRVRRFWAGVRLYRLIGGVVRRRREEGRREEDPLQVLMDRGFGIEEITRFMAMTLFAAVTNTGNIFCWFLVHLSLHPQWKSQVQAEVDAFIESHSSFSSNKGEGQGMFTIDSVADALKRAGLETLDASTSLLDAALHETIRVSFNGFLMRRNIASSLSLSPAHTIPTGTFLLFPTADLHFSPSLYGPSPTTFNPEHFFASAVEKRGGHGTNFLGWGAGRHVCVGRRAALGMMKMVAVLVLGVFDVRVVGEDGEELRETPRGREDMLFKVGRVDGIRTRYARRRNQGLKCA